LRSHAKGNRSSGAPVQGRRSSTHVKGVLLLRRGAYGGIKTCHRGIGAGDLESLNTTRSTTQHWRSRRNFNALPRRPTSRNNDRQTGRKFYPTVCISHQRSWRIKTTAIVRMRLIVSLLCLTHTPVASVSAANRRRGLSHVVANICRCGSDQSSFITLTPMFTCLLRTSGPRSARSSQTGAACSWYSAPDGASRRRISSRPRCSAPRADGHRLAAV
jgi:hypothetical protein